LSRLAKTALARALDRMSALRAFLFDSGARSDSRTTACKKSEQLVSIFRACLQARQRTV